MKLDEKNIEQRAKEILKVRNKLFILNFISKSNKSVRRECDFNPWCSLNP